MRVRDYVIIGAGPAGLQLAYFLKQAGHDYIVLDANEVGHFFTKLPRHRQLISNNKVYTGFDDKDKNLRWDWNSLLSEELDHLFTSYTDDYFPSADTLVEYLRDFRKHFDLNVTEGARVNTVGREADGTFVLTLADESQIKAKRVIVATGHTVPYTPDVPGIEHCESYSEISTDPKEYRNQRVMVVGKGNSGMETAENIFTTVASVHMLSPNPVRLAWNTHHVSDVRAVYNNTLDSYQLKMQNTILDAELVRITKLDSGKLNVTFRYSHAHGQTWDLELDRVILACGFRFDSSIFDESCAVPTTSYGGRWPALTSSWESVDVPNLFLAGTVMQSRDYKQSFSGFIHGFRYNIRFLSQIFGERYHGIAREPERITRTAADLTDLVVSRANQASSMFQLPEFMGDVYLLDEPGEEILSYQDTTVDYALDHPEWSDRALLIQTLEYGTLPPGADPFNVERDPDDGTTSQFIHPVLRLYIGGELVETYHIPEDLENEWDKRQYIDPCQQAIEIMLGKAEKTPVAG